MEDILGMRKNLMRLLILTRGLPGSGKSTLAHQLMGEIESCGDSANIYSTDDYWMEDGEYKFDITKLNEAHAWNFERVKAAIQVYDCVIVDNTNIVWRDFKRYVELAIVHQYDIMLAEPQTAWRNDIDECDQKNTHNVPKETIDRMCHKYQSNEEIIGYAKQMLTRMNMMARIHDVDIFEYDPMKLFKA